jgi:hypothetical protein
MCRASTNTSEGSAARAEKNLHELACAEEFDDLGRVVLGVPVRRIIPHQGSTKIGALCELILVDAARHSNQVAV